jgi:hypothetical protein
MKSACDSEIAVLLGVGLSNPRFRESGIDDGARNIETKLDHAISRRWAFGALAKQYWIAYKAWKLFYSKQKLSLTKRLSEADCLSRIVLFPAARGHDSRQATVSLSLSVRQKNTI